MAPPTNIERTLATLVDFAALQNKSIENLTTAIEQSNRRLVDRIDDLAVQMSSLGDKIDTLGDKVDRIATVTEAQSSHIAQLIALAQQQQATVDRLLAKN